MQAQNASRVSLRKCITIKLSKFEMQYQCRKSKIGRLDARRIKLINFDCTFIPSWIAEICHTCNDLFTIMYSKTSFEKNCFSAWASTLNMGLINKVDMVCLSPVGYGV